MVMGNVLNEELEEIWNNEKYLKLRKDVYDFNPPELCKNCVVLSSKVRLVAENLM